MINDFLKTWYPSWGACKDNSDSATTFLGFALTRFNKFAMSRTNMGKLW